MVNPSLKSPIPGVSDTITFSSGDFRIASKDNSSSLFSSPILPPIPKSGADPASTLKPFLCETILLKRGNSSDTFIDWEIISKELLIDTSKSKPTKPLISSILLSEASTTIFNFVFSFRFDKSFISTFWVNFPSLSSIKNTGSIKNLSLASALVVVL